MPEIRIKKTGAITIQVQLDETYLRFEGDTATRFLPPGKYALQWFAVGAPETTYSLSIESPKSVEFTHIGVLDASQKDSGIHWFVV